jgi:hypothetical protein
VCDTNELGELGGHASTPIRNRDIPCLNIPPLAILLNVCNGYFVRFSMGPTSSQENSINPRGYSDLGHRKNV